LLGFTISPRTNGNYSHIEVSNIIIAIQWMEYMGMIEYLFKFTTKLRKYHKMNLNDGDGDGDGGDAAVDDGDDAQIPKNPSSGEDRCPSARSPSRSLLEVRFLRVLVSTNVGS
jgi:hypothetical protein